MRHRIAVGLTVWLASVIASPLHAGQDALDHAKDLYLSAAYDDALAVLDRLGTDSPADRRTEVAEYRVFCLLALNRSTEARQAIEAIVNTNPFYRPSEAQTSPRIRAVFQDTRKAVLPGVVQKAYAEAKASFDRKDPVAAAQFDRVLVLLDDPDLNGAPQLGDLRTVATGFRDLSQAMSAAASAPPAAPAPAPAVPAAPPAARAVQDGPAPRPAPAAEGPSNLVPPVVISQSLPPWTPPNQVDAHATFNGSVEVAIDETGHVTSAVLRESVHPQYDHELLRIAKTWRYKPATLNGTPTKFVKVVAVHLQPSVAP